MLVISRFTYCCCCCECPMGCRSCCDCQGVTAAAAAAPAVAAGAAAAGMTPAGAAAAPFVTVTVATATAIALLPLLSLWAGSHPLLLLLRLLYDCSIFSVLFCLSLVPLSCLYRLSLLPVLKMARGPRKHIKRVAAPHHWLLDKLTGHYAPRPSPGPHKLRECVPLVILLRNKLKFALTGREVQQILLQRLIRVDGRIRTDSCYPAGFMDVISVDRTQQHFRLLLDTKGRFVPHPIRSEEATYKLCKIRKVLVGKKGVPAAVTHDGRTLRFPHPAIKPHDCVRLDIETGKIIDWVKFESGTVAMVTGGHNVGRVGVLVHRERHLGGFDIVHIRDAKGNEFATRISNVFIIGKGDKPWISLPKEKGVRLSIFENRAVLLKKQQAML